MVEDPSHRRLASRLIDHIGDLGITVAVFRIGPNAESGWELVALNHETGERWTVVADRVLDAASTLADAIGIDLEG